MKKGLIISATVLGALTFATTSANADTTQTSTPEVHIVTEPTVNPHLDNNGNPTDYNKYAVDPLTAENVLKNFNKDTGIPLDSNKVYSIDTYNQPAGKYAINAYEPHDTYMHLLWGFSYDPSTHEVTSLYTSPELNYWHKATDGTYINPDMSMGQTIVHNDPDSVGNGPIIYTGPYTPKDSEVKNPSQLPLDTHQNTSQITPDSGQEVPMDQRIQDQPNDLQGNNSQSETTSTSNDSKSAEQLPQTGNNKAESNAGLALLAGLSLFGLIRMKREY